jgi:hypothetical protein
MWESQIWESKIWSWVPRVSDPRKTALARASSIFKRQTRPLIREGVPQKQDRNCQTVIHIWSWAPDGARHKDLLTNWPSVAMWLTLTDFSQHVSGEAESNTSTLTLQVVGGDEKGTPCLRVKPGLSVPGEYEYGDVALQVGGVSDLRH